MSRERPQGRYHAIRHRHLTDEPPAALLEAPDRHAAGGGIEVGRGEIEGFREAAAGPRKHQAERPQLRGVPITMFALLIVLAYLVTILLGIRNLDGYEPLVLACSMGLAGLINGHAHNTWIGLALGSKAGAAYLPDDHVLTRRVHALADRMQLPRPRVGIMRAMNAYAAGPNPRNSMVVLGVPLVQRLTSDELDAVIGHELGHIATGDVRRMQYGAGFQAMFAGLFGLVGQIVGGTAAQVMRDRTSAQLTLMLARWFTSIGRYVVGFMGQLVLMASSREREYHADAIGAAITSPAAMIGALEKISRGDAAPTEAEADFAYMMFRGRGGSLWATHPTLDQRRAALQDGAYIRQLPRLAADNSHAVTASRDSAEWSEGY